jgi:TIR domain
MPRPKEVFISHSSKNNGFVSKLHATLAAHEIRSFWSPKGINTAERWNKSIGEALKRCDWFLLILSHQSVNSKWVKSEFNYAINHDQYEDRIIPCWWRKCKPDADFWTLDALQHISFMKKQEDAYQKLLATWGISYDPSKLKK